MRYCAVLYGSVWYCAVLYGTVRYCTVLYGTVRYCTVLTKFAAQIGRGVDAISEARQVRVGAASQAQHCLGNQGHMRGRGLR